MSGFDTHEDILVYLTETLLPSISGIATVWRNRGGFPNNIEGQPPVRPAAILLDAGERLTDDYADRKGVKMRPAIYAMKPQIFVVLDQRDDVSNLTLNGVSDPVGPELAQWRMRVRSALENDTGLLSLLTTSGQITYLGHETDMQTGMTMGALGAHIQFHYEFRYVVYPPR